MEKSKLLDKVIAEEGLTELVSGLFVFPETELVRQNQDSIALAVHAYYYRKRSEGRNSGYSKAIADFISHEKRPIVFALNEVRFEESEAELRQSLEWIKNLGAAKNSLLYFTIPMDSQPMEKWASVISGIEQVLSPKLIEIVGAEVNYLPNGELAGTGCVNGTKEALQEHFNVKLLPEYCWTDTSYSWRPYKIREDIKLGDYEEHLKFIKELRERELAEEAHLKLRLVIK